MSFRLFPTTTVNATNSYASRVISGKQRRNVLFTLTNVNGSTGSIARQHNDLPEEEYAAACGFAMEESRDARETKEAANNVGWRNVDWRESDSANLSAGSQAMVSTTSANAVSATFAPGPTRERYLFTNTLNTGTLDGFCESGK